MKNQIHTVQARILFKKELLASILFLLTLHTLQAQDTIYVDDNAMGLNDGSSWTNAYTNLTDAFEGIEEGDEVWVAKGNYSTTVAAKYGSCVTLPAYIRDGVSIYGSLDINEDPHVDTRDFDANASIISGPLGKPHLNFSQVDALAPLTILDGFQFTGDGSGLLVSSGNIEIHNCEFSDLEGNSIIQLNSADVEVYNSTFSSNTIVDFGAVIVASKSSDAYFENCWFKENESYAPTSLFEGVLLSTSSTLDFFNCIFLDNEAFNEQAVQNNNSSMSKSDVTLVNCSFYNNSSDVNEIDEYYDDIYVYNSIVFENTSMDFIDASAVSITLDHSIVPTGYTGTDLIHSDPQMTGSSLELCSTSPALDEGNNAFNATSFDIDGDTRTPTGTTIDIGAQEGSVSCPVPFQDPVTTQEISSIGVRVYPNPVSHQLYFELPETAQMAAIIDLQGRILLSINQVDKGVHSFDLSGFEDGVYLLSIESASGSEKITVVKQH